MHILLAEDSESMALLVISYLKKQGYCVTYVKNGLAAIEAYQTDRPDIVLMDVLMPEMDGIEATRRIKALGGTHWVPVIMMTGLSSPEEIISGLEAGADDYLTKPVILPVLNARMRAMQRIAVMQESLEGILNNTHDAIITINGAGIMQSYNQAAERIFGYAAHETVGQNVKMLMPPPYTEEHDGYLARYHRERTPHIVGIGRKVQGRRKNGEVFAMRLAVTEITQSSESLFIGLVSDISAEEAARQHIEFLALHDTLTGLPNRAHFNDQLEGILQAVMSQQHALMFIDLDGFKPINDQYGHEVGDAALKTVATRLRHNLAANDFAARLGGDEFVAIARNVADATAAKTVAQRLIDAISEPMTLLDQECQLGASIGIALIPQHGNTASEVLIAADNAMYAAKRAGKRRAVIANETPASA